MKQKLIIQTKKNSLESKNNQRKSAVHTGLSKILSMKSRKFDEENVNMFENAPTKLLFDNKKNRSSQSINFLTNFLQLNSELFKNENLSPEEQKNLDQEKKALKKIVNILESSKDQKNDIDSRFETNNEELAIQNLNLNKFDTGMGKILDIGHGFASKDKDKSEMENFFSFKSLNKKMDENILERIMIEFDKMKNFEFYYPQYNIENVIKKFNEGIIRTKKAKKKRNIPNQDLNSRKITF